MPLSLSDLDPLNSDHTVDLSSILCPLLMSASRAQLARMPFFLREEDPAARPAVQFDVQVAQMKMFDSDIQGVTSLLSYANRAIK